MLLHCDVVRPARCSIFVMTGWWRVVSVQRDWRPEVAFEIRSIRVAFKRAADRRSSLKA